MPKFIIERELAGAGDFSDQQWHEAAQKSCSVIENMREPVQWINSYVTDDKVYCVYIAPNEHAVREHAERGGFPANRVAPVKRIIDPTTAEDGQRR
jgi:hypothetical protein